MRTRPSHGSGRLGGVNYRPALLWTLAYLVLWLALAGLAFGGLAEGG
jgi:hypothetical protein